MASPFKDALASRPFQLFLMVVAVVAAIFFIGKAVGKAKAEKPTPLPDNGQGIPKGWNPAPLAELVHDKITGLFEWSAAKEDCFLRLMDLTNDQLVAVYNLYNKRFASGGFFSSRETMTAAIQNEWSVSFGSVRPQLLARLRGLNCS